MASLRLARPPASAMLLHWSFCEDVGEDEEKEEEKDRD